MVERVCGWCVCAPRGGNDDRQLDGRGGVAGGGSPLPAPGEHNTTRRGLYPFFSSDPLFFARVARAVFFFPFFLASKKKRRPLILRPPLARPSQRHREGVQWAVAGAPWGANLTWHGV